MDAIFVGILLHDSVCNFGVEFEIKVRAQSKSYWEPPWTRLGQRLKLKANVAWDHVKLITNEFLKGKIYM